VPAPLLVADLPWLLYRAYFSLPRSIIDGEGKPVGALLGTVNALLAAIESRPPRAVVACTGAEAAAYRIALYPAYHAHREPMPDELQRQWERAPRLRSSFSPRNRPSRSIKRSEIKTIIPRRGKLSTAVRRIG
jgi:5'-3' exonuclease